MNAFSDMRASMASTAWRRESLSLKDAFSGKAGGGSNAASDHIFLNLPVGSRLRATDVSPSSVSLESTLRPHARIVCFFGAPGGNSRTVTAPPDPPVPLSDGIDQAATEPATATNKRRVLRRSQ